MRSGHDRRSYGPLSLKDALEMLRRIHGSTEAYDRRLPAIRDAVSFLVGKK